MESAALLPFVQRGNATRDPSGLPHSRIRWLAPGKHPPREHVAHWRKREPRSHVGQSVALIVHSRLAVPFMSGADLEAALKDATVPPRRPTRSSRSTRRAASTDCAALRRSSHCLRSSRSHSPGDPNHRTRTPGQTQTSPASRDPVAPPGASVKARSGAVQPDCWDGVGKGHCRPRTGLPQPSCPGGSIGVPRSRNCGSLVAVIMSPVIATSAPCAGAGASGHCYVPVSAQCCLAAACRRCPW